MYNGANHPSHMCSDLTGKKNAAGAKAPFRAKTRQCISSQNDTLLSSGLLNSWKGVRTRDPGVPNKAPAPCREEVGCGTGEDEREKEKQPCLAFLKIIRLLSWRKQRRSAGAAEMSKRQSHKRNAALEQAVTFHHRLPDPHPPTPSKWPESDPHRPAPPRKAPSAGTQGFLKNGSSNKDEITMLSPCDV